MYNNILVPVVMDEDATAKNKSAIAAAQELAQDGARITLLHVIEMVPMYVADYIPRDFLVTARETLVAELEKLAKGIPNCDVAIAEGKAGPRITTWVEEHDNDCVVVASHQPAFSDILLGSVAQHVVRHVTCTVLVLK